MWEEPPPHPCLAWKAELRKGELGRGGMPHHPTADSELQEELRRAGQSTTSVYQKLRRMTSPDPGSHYIRGRVGPGAPKGAGSQGEDRLPKWSLDLRRRTVNTENTQMAPPWAWHCTKAPCGLDSFTLLGFPGGIKCKEPTCQCRGF